MRKKIFKSIQCRRRNYRHIKYKNIINSPRTFTLNMEQYSLHFSIPNIFLFNDLYVHCFRIIIFILSCVVHFIPLPDGVNLIKPVLLQIFFYCELSEDASVFAMFFFFV